MENRDEELKKLTESINKRNHAKFIDRIKNPNRKFIKDRNANDISTHKMTYATMDGSAVAFPDIQETNGELYDFTDPKHHRGKWDAMNSAISHGNTLMMSGDQAKSFTENYKRSYPKFENGGKTSQYQMPADGIFQKLLDKYKQIRAKEYSGEFKNAFNIAKQNNEPFFKWNQKVYSTKTAEEEMDFGDYIRKLENPDKIGWNEEEKKWYRPPAGKGYDHNQIAYGLDTKKNDETRKFLGKTKRIKNPWLYEHEAQKLMEDNLNYSLSQARKYFDNLKKKYPSINPTKQQIYLLGGYHYQYGNLNYIKHPNGPLTRRIHEATKNPDNKELIDAIYDLYKHTNQERARNLHRFFYPSSK